MPSCDQTDYRVDATMMGKVAHGSSRERSGIALERNVVRGDMSAAELRALPAVVDLRTAAAVLNIGRTSAYELVRAGQWPTPILRLGGRIKVPTAPLLELLRVSTEPVQNFPNRRRDSKGRNRCQHPVRAQGASGCV
jgi:hypothetical protein